MSVELVDGHTSIELFSRLEPHVLDMRSSAFPVDVDEDEEEYDSKGLFDMSEDDADLVQRVSAQSGTAMDVEMETDTDSAATSAMLLQHDKVARQEEQVWIKEEGHERQGQWTQQQHEHGKRAAPVVKEQEERSKQGGGVRSE